MRTPSPRGYEVARHRTSVVHEGERDGGFEFDRGHEGAGGVPARNPAAHLGIPCIAGCGCWNGRTYRLFAMDHRPPLAGHPGLTPTEPGWDAPLKRRPPRTAGPLGTEIWIPGDSSQRAEAGLKRPGLRSRRASFLGGLNRDQLFGEG
jgi:hypothetical protein